MTTSALPDILTDVLDKQPIPADKIAYLVARSKLRLHNFILARLAAAEDASKLDQAKIARRLKVSRARISQQLGVPGNWTIESVTKLAAAIGGEIDYLWMPFQKLETKTECAPSGQLSQPFQAPAPDEIVPLNPDESDVQP